MIFGTKDHNFKHLWHIFSYRKLSQCHNPNIFFFLILQITDIISCIKNSQNIVACSQYRHKINILFSNIGTCFSKGEKMLMAVHILLIVVFIINKPKGQLLR